MGNGRGVAGVPRSSLSGSATRCRSLAGRCWWSRASLGAGSGRAAPSDCGWRTPGGTEPGDAACPGRRFCCIQTTPRCPSWLGSERGRGTDCLSQQETAQTQASRHSHQGGAGRPHPSTGLGGPPEGHRAL